MKSNLLALANLPWIHLFSSTACNLSCKYCSQADVRTDKVRFDLLKEHNFLDFIKSIQPSHFYISGGEPLIHEGIEDFIKFASTHGHIISIDTNACVSRDRLEHIVNHCGTKAFGFINISHHLVENVPFDFILQQSAVLKSSHIPHFIKYIGVPEHLGRIKQYMNELHQRKIGAAVSILYGDWQGRNFPSAYTVDESLALLDLCTLATHGLQLFGGFRSLGQPCRAGSDYVTHNMHGKRELVPCCHTSTQQISFSQTYWSNDIRQKYACQSETCLGDIMFIYGVNGMYEEIDRFTALCCGEYDFMGSEAILSEIDRMLASGHQLSNPSKFAEVRSQIAAHRKEPLADRRESEAKKPGIFIDEYSLDIATTHVFDLHLALGFQSPLDFPKSSLIKKFSQWKMEVDDAPIFRYIYRQARPRRHLEFGTWQGKGTVFCLEECEATVWTINMPFGEGDYGFYPEEMPDAHAWAQKVGIAPAPTYTSDAIGFIGKSYLERGLGNRVCQIYCDSCEWDTANYPPGFFDSILIDGGHTVEVVANDTRKAFPLLRSGGIILWHDFCPTDYQRFEACRGVMAGVAREWGFIAEQTEKLFWIYPSMILVGIKK